MCAAGRIVTQQSGVARGCVGDTEQCYRSAVLPGDGQVRSEICRSLMSYLNIIVNHMKIVCILG